MSGRVRRHRGPAGRRRPERRGRQGAGAVSMVPWAGTPSPGEAPRPARSAGPRSPAPQAGTPIAETKSGPDDEVATGTVTPRSPTPPSARTALPSRRPSASGTPRPDGPAKGVAGDREREVSVAVRRGRPRTSPPPPGSRAGRTGRRPEESAGPPISRNPPAAHRRPPVRERGSVTHPRAPRPVTARLAPSPEDSVEPPATAAGSIYSVRCASPPFAGNPGFPFLP